MKKFIFQTDTLPGKVLIHAAADTNHDKRFKDDDINTPYIYDLNTVLPAQKVFDTAFKDTLFKLLKQQWNPEK